MAKRLRPAWLGAKDALFMLYSCCNCLLNLPGMTPKERRIIKDILKESSKKNKINILEWGGGGSTIYYARYLKALDASFEWHSIENSAEWAGKVVRRLERYKLRDMAHIHLFEFTPFWQKPGWDWSDPRPEEFGLREEAERRYIIFPETLGLKFDVIIIDGRFRRRCLIEAQKFLAPSGCVILHDAQKTHYHSPLNSYKYGKFFESKYIDVPYLHKSGDKKWCKMWIGSNEKKKFMKINRKG